MNETRVALGFVIGLGAFVIPAFISVFLKNSRLRILAGICVGGLFYFYAAIEMFSIYLISLLLYGLLFGYLLDSDEHDRFQNPQDIS